jgi:hypothetical protein
MLSLLKMAMKECKLLSACHVEFEHDVWKGLGDTWRIPFAALLKLSFIVYQYGCKSDL